MSIGVEIVSNTGKVFSISTSCAQMLCARNTIKPLSTGLFICLPPFHNFTSPSLREYMVQKGEGHINSNSSLSSKTERVRPLRSHPQSPATLSAYLYHLFHRAQKCRAHRRRWPEQNINQRGTFLPDHPSAHLI